MKRSKLYGLSLPAGGSFLLSRLADLAQALENVALDERIEASPTQRERIPGHAFEQIRRV